MSVNKGIPVEELRLLKSLLDEGIITEKEFAEKKRQLLDLPQSNDSADAYVDQSIPNDTSEISDAAGDTSTEKMSDRYMWNIRYEEVTVDKEVALDSEIASNNTEQKMVKESSADNDLSATDYSVQNSKRKNALNYSELCEEISADVDGLFKCIDDSLIIKQEMSDLDYFNAVIDYYRRWKDGNEYDARIKFERTRYTEALYNGFNAYLSRSEDPKSAAESISGLTEIISSDEMPMKYFSDIAKPMVGWNSGQFSTLMNDRDKAKYIGVSKYALAFAALLGAKTFHDVELPKDRKQVISDIATEALYLGFWYAELTSPGVLFNREIAQMAKSRTEYYNSIADGSRTGYGSWAKPFLSEYKFNELSKNKEGRAILAFGDQIMPHIIRHQSSTSIVGLLFGKQKTREEADNPEPYWLCLLRFLLNNANVYFKVLEQCKSGNGRYLPSRIANSSYR